MRLRPKHILAAVFISGLLLHNIVDITQLYKKISRLNKDLVFNPPGREFAGFQERLAGVETAGFLTDKNMSPEKNDGLFLMAQYALAPVILDLDNTAHTDIILDCQNYFHALDLMKKADAAPVYTNDFGKILARKSRP